MLIKTKKKIKSLSHFIWLVLLIIITSFVTYFYETNKKSQYESLKKTLDNVYFKKTFSKITSSLENRYLILNYVVKEGDNYENIINNLEVSKYEKKYFLKQ